MIAGAIFIATMMLQACSRAFRKFVLFMILAGLLAVAVLARFWLRIPPEETDRVCCSTIGCRTLDNGKTL